MPADFCKADHGPRKLRTTTLCGLVFATLAPETPPIEEYLGAEILGRVRRVMSKPVQVLGRFTQGLPNNWKLYFENVKDTYHASLLHAFFGTFRITRLTQGGGVLVSPDGAHHASYTIGVPEDARSAAYREQWIRSELDGFRLADARLLDSVDEINDRIQLQILTVFPNHVIQQVQNSLAVRQIVPTGVASMELHWTYIGFADDDAEMRQRRLRPAHPVGPPRHVSLGGGCGGGLLPRGAAPPRAAPSPRHMGGGGDG